MDTRFHCVYLLTSLDPRFEGCYYIGYTVSPLRRLRQHNGELTNGALRTHRRGRPWTLVCCVSGFSEDRAALRFEWSWQHPLKSAAIKSDASARATLGRLGRHLPYAVATMHCLLRCDPFAQLSLRVNVLDGPRFDNAAALALGAGAPALRVGPLLSIVPVTREELAALSAGGDSACADEDTAAAEAAARERHVMEQGLHPCSLCSLPLYAAKTLRCGGAVHVAANCRTSDDALVDEDDGDDGVAAAILCPFAAHIACAAMLYHFEASLPACSASTASQQQQQQLKAELVPTNEIQCPLCRRPQQWASLVARFKATAAADMRRREEERKRIFEQTVSSRLREAGFAGSAAGGGRAKRARGAGEPQTSGTTSPVTPALAPPPRSLPQSGATAAATFVPAVRTSVIDDDDLLSLF